MNSDSRFTLSRRAFVASSLALTSLHSIPAFAGSAVSLAIFDRRFDEGLAFQRSMAVRGAAVIGFESDVTSVWLKTLDPAWRSRAAHAVAGLTTEQTLFCLERLGWDHRLRVVERFALGAVKLRCGTHCEPLVSWVIASPNYLPL